MEFNPVKIKQLAFCSFRYALGRSSYIVSDIQDFILSNQSIFSITDFEQMIREIDEASDLGMKMDVLSWNDFKDKLIKLTHHN